MDDPRLQREKIYHQIRLRMEDVQHISILPSDEKGDSSIGTTSLRLTYEQYGVQKNWEFVSAKDSFATIVFNTSNHKLVFLRRFRPLAYYSCIPKIVGPVDTNKYPPSIGITTELCGDFLLTSAPILEVARDELMRDAGFDAPIENFEILQSYKCVTDAPATQTLLYVEVTNDMFVSTDLQLDNLIEVAEMNIEEAKKYISNSEVNSTSSLIHAVLWFLTNKQDRYC